ncbi:trypsin 5G1-like [Polistes fuscatus]|uniref:trypsin 5G1-like n=1 Tax=Polistes fuscatus TaxID=30207 RepID=UPI001CA93B1E|nr:trypsin 5G1-like [Polistes fuscatus]
MFWTVVFICLIYSRVVHNEREMHNVKHRIIGGHYISIKSRPFMVSLHDELNNFQCGASILSKKWVITALHCFNSLDQNNYHVRAGSNYTDHGGTLHNVKNIHTYDETTYPYWSTKIYYHDIALFKVSPPFRFSSTTRPINLPNDDKKPRRLYASGWGYTSLNSNSHPTLMTVNIPYVPFKACVNSVPLYKLLVRRDRHLCYGRRGKDSCYGDSGGPLADAHTIYGIVSFGYNCGKVSGIYAKISYYREWIKTITKL